MVRIREPQQARSRDTLARILRATEVLLRRTPFEALAVQRIVARAGCSVGAFYERFPNKESLLPYLLERYYAELEERLDDFLAPGRWRGLDLGARVERLVALLIDHTRGREGLMRALWLRNHQSPASVPLSIRRLAGRHAAALHGLLLDRREEIAHRDPELAVRLGFFVVGGAVQERLLFPESPNPSSAPVDADALHRELTQMFLGYLRAPSRSARGSGGPS